MAVMPPTQAPKPVALRIPGVTDIGSAMAPVGVQPPSKPYEFTTMPVGTPVVTPAPPSVAQAPPVPTSMGRSAAPPATTTLPQINIGNQTFTQGQQINPGPNGVGLFGVKIPGSPQGAPANPQPRTIWRGPQGVWYAWRPNGPNGDGWYRLGTTGGGDQVETKPVDETTPTPTPTPTPDAGATGGGGTTTTPSFTFDPNWWMQQFTGTPDYQMTAPGIQAEENRIASSFGFQIRRDTTQGSPTYGQILYRPRGSGEGAGAIVAKLVAVPGSTPPQAKYVYVDASGKEYDPATLEIDIVRLKPGEAGYEQGQIGQAEMASAARRPDIGVSAARAGAGRSGVRAVAASREVQALQAALANLIQSAGTRFAETGTRWSDLINRLYPGLAESAQALVDASQTPPAGEAPPADGGGAPGGGEAPPAPPAAQPGPSFSAPNGITYGVGDRIAAGPNGVGMFSAKGTPGGTPPKNPKPRELFRGKGGVWWAWRPNGPKGKGWYRYVPEAPGAPSPTQAGVTTQTSGTQQPATSASATQTPTASGPQFSFGGRSYSQGDRIPAGANGVGKFSRKGAAPAGAPPKPPAGTLHRGKGGVWFVYRPSGPNGAGWYRRP